MPRDGLIRNLAEAELEHLKLVRTKIVVLSVVISIAVCSLIAIAVTAWSTHLANRDSVERGLFNCNLQVTGRIEGNKRVTYELIEKTILEARPRLLDGIRAKHPDWFDKNGQLPPIGPLPTPDCRKQLPGG